MEKQNLKELAEIMAVVGDVHGKEISQPLISLYFEQLKQFSISDIRKAFSKPTQWFPKPFDIIEAIQGHGQVSVKDQALIQANLVADAIATVGRYESVKFTDPVTNMVVKQGFNGWINLCSEMLEKEIVWFKKDFAALYKSYSRGNIKSSERLVGWFEAENLKLGIEYWPKVRLIGLDTERKQIES